MEQIMKVAQSFQYKGTPVLITINNISESATIVLDNETVTVKSKDINYLNFYARDLIDRKYDNNRILVNY